MKKKQMEFYLFFPYFNLTIRIVRDLGFTDRNKYWKQISLLNFLDSGLGICPNCRLRND